MTIIKGVTSLIIVMALLAAATVVLSVDVSAQTLNMGQWAISYTGSTRATVGQQYTISWSVSDQSGTYDNDAIPAGQITLTVDGSTTGITPSSSPAVNTGSTGAAVATYVFSAPGTHTLGISIPQQVNLDGDGDYWLATSATTTISVSGGATVAPTPTPVVTPVVTPIVTPQPGQVTITPPTTPTTVVYPPTTVINQYFPGTVTTGTNPATGDPAIQVTNRPSSTKLQTTLIDFASDPAKNTANFGQAVQTAKNNGWTLSAQGQRTYSDPSQDYRYARFVKGGNTLSLQAIGNNSTSRMNGIPGDILLSQTDETFDSGGLFGLSQLATWALFIVIAVVVLAIIIGLVWYRRRGREDEDRQGDEGQQYEQ